MTDQSKQARRNRGRRIAGQNRKSENRRYIVEAAESLFMQDYAERGTARQVTHQRVADKAGFAVTTLYNHFPTRELLAASVIEALKERNLEVPAEFEAMARLQAARTQGQAARLKEYKERGFKLISSNELEDACEIAASSGDGRSLVDTLNEKYRRKIADEKPTKLEALALARDVISRYPTSDADLWWSEGEILKIFQRSYTNQLIRGSKNDRVKVSELVSDVAHALKDRIIGSVDNLDGPDGYVRIARGENRGWAGGMSAGITESGSAKSYILRHELCVAVWKDAAVQDDRRFMNDLVELLATARGSYRDDVTGILLCAWAVLPDLRKELTPAILEGLAPRRGAGIEASGDVDSPERAREGVAKLLHGKALTELEEYAVQNMHEYGDFQRWLAARSAISQGKFHKASRLLKYEPRLNCRWDFILRKQSKQLLIEAKQSRRPPSRADWSNCLILLNDFSVYIEEGGKLTHRQVLEWLDTLRMVTQNLYESPSYRTRPPGFYFRYDPSELETEI